MDIILSRQAGADIDELADTRIGRQELYRALQEQPVMPAGENALGNQPQQLFCRVPVGSVIILPAQPVLRNSEVCRQLWPDVAQLIHVEKRATVYP